MAYNACITIWLVIGKGIVISIINIPLLITGHKVIQNPLQDLYLNYILSPLNLRMTMLMMSNGDNDDDDDDGHHHHYHRKSSYSSSSSVHVCIHACMSKCMHGCMYACMHVCMHVYKYACIHVCMHASTSLNYHFGSSLLSPF